MMFAENPDPDLPQIVPQSIVECRVSPSFRDKNGYSFNGNIVNHLQEQKFSTFEGTLDDVDGIHKLQTKYASPDNLQQQNINVQININAVEADAVKTNGSSSAFSDTSSDVSDITTSVLSANSGYVLPVVEGISEHEFTQVDLFYRSQKTDVKVCRSLANLYVSIQKVKVNTTETQSVRVKKKSFREKKSKSTLPQAPSFPSSSDFTKDDWEFSKTGIPALVLETGDHIREKKLKIVLAEKGTGFTLWEDQFNRFTEYSTPHTNFHTITISTDSTRLVGLSFDDGKAATEFAETVKSLTTSADDDVSSNKKKKKKEKPKKYRPPKKVDISQPVCFVHVTRIKRPDLIASLFPPPPTGAESNRLGIPRAVSDSSGISECSTVPSDR